VETRHSPVALVENQCVISAGTSPLNAFDRLEVMEYSAKSMLIKYFDLGTGIVESMPDAEEIRKREDIVCYNCYMKEGDSIGMVTDGRSVMGRGFYVVKADTLADAGAVCAEIENKFTIREV
jgi:hypothetical protein